MREIFHKGKTRRDVSKRFLYVFIKVKLTWIESFEYFGYGGRGFDGGGDWRGASATVKGKSRRFHCWAIVTEAKCSIDCGSAGTLGNEIIYILNIVWHNK
jgi:hypothetical protein